MFTKVAPRSISDEIVDQVISAIFSGKLPAGSKLPAERALSQTFGVGRQALREAIQKLQGMGLLEVRKPQGTFVKALTTAALRQPLARLFNGDVGSFLHFLDLRKWMEATTAAEAAEHATAADIRRIEGTLPRLHAAAARRDREALDEADVAFHMAIVAATHNSPLVHLVDTFGNLMWASHGLRLAVLRAQNLETICEEHTAIAQAIRGRAPDRAQDAMLRHIEMTRNRVERVYGPDAHGAAAPRPHPQSFSLLTQAR
ncbi:MAG: FadR/GntR family transcriptional regulator [candidate division NC10 bacterium]|nr:FadR/GntR family transcriptional regulator [candidate division NC10 bacterium]